MAINTGQSDKNWGHFSDENPRPNPKKSPEFYDPKPIGDILFGDGFTNGKPEAELPYGDLQEMIDGI